MALSSRPLVVMVAVVLLASCCRRCGGQELNLYACTEYNATTRPVDVFAYAGVWYEVLRLPSSTAGICVSLLAPNATTAAGEYEVAFDYVNNFASAQKELQPVHEVVTFPWNEQTQAGVFELDYEAVQVVFKLVPQPFISDVAVVCGYALVPGALPLVKFFSRQKQLNPAVVKQIEALAEAYNVSEHITWVEQNDCSAAPASFAASLVLNAIRIAAVIFSVLWKI